MNDNYDPSDGRGDLGLFSYKVLALYEKWYNGTRKL